MKNLMENIWYWIVYGYSWAAYILRLCLRKSQDRLDYFEIVRFQLWNSVVSDDGVESRKRKAERHGYVSPQIWIYSAYFTKFRLKAETFLPVRGIGWDRGVDSDSLEARLVQSEYYVSIAKIVDKTEFQAYVQDNYPKRYMFSKLWYQDVWSSPNLIPWAQFIYSSNLVLWVFHILSLMLLLWIILPLEILYLYLCLLGLRIGHRSRIYTPVFLVSRHVYAQVLVLISFIIFPVFYIIYPVAISLWVFTDFVCGCFYLGYVVSARYMFRIGLIILDSYERCICRLVHLMPSHSNPITWMIYLQFWSFRLVSYLGGGVNHFIYYHWIIHLFIRFIVQILRSLSIAYAIVNISIYFNLHLVLIWIANYLVLIVISVGYEGLLSPLLASVIVALTLAVLVPNTFRFVRIPTAILVAASMPGVAYIDRLLVSEVSTTFYKTLSSRDDLPWRLNWWPLANEVLSLKYMAKEDTFGSNADRSRDLIQHLSEAPNSQGQKLAVLAEYFNVARANIATKRVLELGQVPAFGLGMPYEGQSESDEPIVVSKFLPDEFQSFQSNLTRLYYLISVDSNESPGLSNRVVFGHRFGCRVDTEHVRNPYESGFIYMDSFSKLYMRRIPEFSALFETRYFYLRVPSRFVPRAAWVPSSELPLPVSDSLVKLVNAQMSSIWDSNCLSTVNSWRSRSIDYPTRRSFGNSPNFFDSKFNVNLNDWSQVKLYALVDHSNRNSHIGISMYFQLQYDIYWIFRSNTNIFTMYAFRPDFHFSDISFKFPHWLLGNLSPNLVNSIAYQDDIGSLYTHVLLLQVNIGDCFAASGIFYEALARLAKSGHRHYDQYLFNHLDSESLIHTSDLKVFRVIDRERSQSQGKVSEGVSDWADNLIFESVARDRAMINQMVVDYLAKELEIIPKSAMGDFQSLRVNYLYQSLYSTYLHARTEISFKRFVLKGEAKLGNFASDVMAMVRNLMFVYTADDRLLDREPESKKHIAVFEQLYLQRQKFVEYLKAIFRVFPSSRFIGIDSILGVFIAGAYVYTDYTTWPLNMRTLLNVRHKILHPRESDELWNFFMDCGVFIIYWIITWL